MRDHEDHLGLNKGADFVRFIDRDFAFYTHWYERLRLAANTLTPSLESVFFNAEHNYTLQYGVVLSPLQVTDSEETITRKLRVTAAYLDIPDPPPYLEPACHRPLHDAVRDVPGDA